MRIAIIVSVLVLLVALGCTRTTTSCDDLSGSARENCLLEAGECAAMSDGELRDNCYAQEARVMNDTAVCDSIIGSLTRDYCIEQVAVVRNDKTLCAKINSTYWKDNCNFNLATGGDREALCALINHIPQREECFETIALQSGRDIVCNFLPRDKIESCIFSVAVNTTTASTCNRIANSFNKDVCVYNVAARLNDSSLCDGLRTRDIKQRCRERIGINVANDTDLIPVDTVNSAEA